MTQHVAPTTDAERQRAHDEGRDAELGIRFTLYRDPDGRIVAGWMHERPPGSGSWHVSRAGAFYDVTDAYHELQWTDETGAAGELREAVDNFTAAFLEPAQRNELDVNSPSDAAYAGGLLQGFVARVSAVADRLRDG